VATIVQFESVVSEIPLAPLNVFTAACAHDPQQAAMASTSDMQQTPQPRRPAPAAAPASLVPVVTMMDFMAARPESRDPFLPDARASEPGRRLCPVRLTRHPNGDSHLQTMCQRMSCNIARTDPSPLLGSK
jgi:hypothetical protein